MENETDEIRPPAPDPAERAPENPAVMEVLKRIEEKISSSNEFQQAKETYITRLSQKVEQYEQDLLFKIRESAILDIITIYDSVGRVGRKVFEMGDRSLNTEMDILKEEIESILYRNDVELIPLTSDDKFKREVHKVIKKEITYDESAHESVIIIRSGFQHKDRILRKHEVILKTLE